MDRVNENKFSILVSSFNYGGIEILVKRMAAILKNRYSVHVFLLTNKYNNVLFEELEKYAKVHLPKDYLIFNYLPDVAGCNSVLPVKKTHVDVLNSSKYIHVTDSHCLAFLMANLASGKSFKGISVGNYQSEEYIWKARWYFRKMEQNFFRHLSAKSVYSMNNISISKLAEVYGEDFLNSNIMPAGIELPSILSNERLSDRKKCLVCVGRLVKFKSYIEYVIRDIPKILEEIPDFEFHIYGDGPERRYLEGLSKGLPVEFKGSIDISMLNQAISRYRVFIGSGTAILTASSLGIPSVIGIESIRKSETYGFLFETTGLDYQEIGLNYPRYKIHTKVIEALKANESDYREMCSKSRGRSEVFCITNSISMLENSIETSNHAIGFTVAQKIRYFISVFSWALINKLGITKSKLNRHYINVPSE